MLSYLQVSAVIIYEYPDISAFKFFAALYPYDLSAMITWLYTIHNAGVPLVCCGEKMKALVPNTVEASGEKHLPVAELSGAQLGTNIHRSFEAGGVPGVAERGKAGESPVFPPCIFPGNVVR